MDGAKLGCVQITSKLEMRGHKYTTIATIALSLAASRLVNLAMSIHTNVGHRI